MSSRNITKFRIFVILSPVLLAIGIWLSIFYGGSNNAMEQEVQLWIGRRIEFPKEGISIISGDSSYVDKLYKIMIYINSKECTNCNLKLIEWDRLYKVFDQFVPDKLDIVILYDGQNKNDILSFTQISRWDRPIIWDPMGKINSKYKFSKYITLHCMLLDNNNKVLLVGNPLYSREVCELYIRYFIEHTQ